MEHAHTCYQSTLMKKLILTPISVCRTYSSKSTRLRNTSHQTHPTCLRLPLPLYRRSSPSSTSPRLMWAWSSEQRVAPSTASSARTASMSGSWTATAPTESSSSSSLAQTLERLTPLTRTSTRSQRTASASASRQPLPAMATARPRLPCHR